MHTTSLVAITLLLAVSLCRGAIIARSSIKDCTWGDTSEPSEPGGSVCSKKMLISMVLGSGQGNTESLYANVGKAQEEGKEEMSVLKKPFRIELRKTAVVASYRAYLIGSANALPEETSIRKKACVDDFFASLKRLPCGIQFNKRKKRVWDSQGFCCRCTDFESSRNVRGGHSCDLGNLIQSRSSAHCMKMDDLWYDVFTLEMPMMQYKITLDVLELQGITVNNSTGNRHVDWRLISTFHLSPSRTIGRSKSGQVIAELQGSLLGSKSIKDLSSKNLLIPSVRMWPKGKPYPPAYSNGPSDWMLVDNSMVRLLGTECNKIGVSYTGFRRQPGRCKTQQGFCFHNQPLQLWQYDNEKRKKKQSGRYMIHNYGKVHHNSHPNNDSFILKFFHDDLHNSFVTLRIDASDITFVRSVSSGRIVEMYTVPFTAAVGHGSLTVEVGNTGEVLSEYSVSVTKCTSGLHDIAAKKLSLEPGEVRNTSFTLRSGDTDGGQKECEVQLYDSNFNLLDVAKINIKVGAACLCFGVCGCVCEDDENARSLAQCSMSGPPTIYAPGPIGLTLFFMVLESIGAHGFIGFFASILLLLGFIKLSCGGIICCRKTKAQEHTKKMIDKGVPPKSPLLVQCSGECRGAKAARARYERKVKRLRAAGKSPHRLDDWRNTSFECNCKTELTDVRMIHIVRTVCFFYFCCILPFIWLGRCLVWRIFRDTEVNMAKAEQQVLMRAKKKGKLEKYGVVDLAAELKKFEEESEQLEKEKKAKDEASAIVQALAMNVEYTHTESDGEKDVKETTEEIGEKEKKSKSGKLHQQDIGGEKKPLKMRQEKVEHRQQTERKVQEQRASPEPQRMKQQRKKFAEEELGGEKKLPEIGQQRFEYRQQNSGERKVQEQRASPKPQRMKQQRKKFAEEELGEKKLPKIGQQRFTCRQQNSGERKVQEQRASPKPQEQRMKQQREELAEEVKRQELHPPKKSPKTLKAPKESQSLKKELLETKHGERKEKEEEDNRRGEEKMSKRSSQPENLCASKEESGSGTSRDHSGSGAKMDHSGSTDHSGSGTSTDHSGSGTSTDHSGSGTNTNHSGSGTSTNHSGSGTSMDHRGSCTNTDHSGSGTNTNHSGSGTSTDHIGSDTNTNHSGSGTSMDHSGSGTSTDHSGSGTSTDHSGSGTNTNHSGSGTSMDHSGSGTSTDYSGSGTSTDHSGSGTNTDHSGSGTSTDHSGSGTSMEHSGSGASTDHSGSDASTDHSGSDTSTVRQSHSETSGDQEGTTDSESDSETNTEQSTEGGSTSQQSLSQPNTSRWSNASYSQQSQN